MLNEKQVSVLTEEELGKWERNFRFQSTGESYVICWLIASHRTINSRNAKLVHENDELMAQVERLKWICQRSSDFIDAMVGFTGQNLSVFNWHQNGDGEPFDNFVEENLEENLIADLKTALEELNHE